MNHEALLTPPVEGRAQHELQEAGRQVFFGDSVCHSISGTEDGGHTLLHGEPHVCIRNVDALPPFLMSIVSSSDHWLFVGSHGAFTAGRVDPDSALFPYQTVDKILRHPDASGALTCLLIQRGDAWALWEPWQEAPRVYDLTRNLYKHVLGTSVVFEETNRDLGLRFRCVLTTSERYGFVRHCVLENLTDVPVKVRCLDGWNHLIPPGVSQETYARFSYLASAYMRHESLPSERLAIYTLNSGITDRAEPSESLRTACAWSLGHNQPAILLSSRQLEAFRRGEEMVPEHEVRGEFGAYLTADSFEVAAGGMREWFTVADTHLDHGALIRVRDELADTETLRASLIESMKCNQQQLRARIAAADGLQQTADQSASAHHFANVLFNCMRGGTPVNAYQLPAADFSNFLKARSAAVFARQTKWLEGLPVTLTLADLRKSAAKTGDAQLDRLAREYLPLTFSRRHGDPSRPWNRFSIHVKDAKGQPIYGYQGNWRDIFQNWESLAQSYPVCLPSMIAAFLNASTADGYNPYRITREGIDWEVEGPNDPWGHIGYWGDHQIIYLLRLLECHERFQPGRLGADLGRRLYACAVVPYKIADFADLARDPRNSIKFDHDLHNALLARAATMGNDGKLRLDANGEVILVSLAEKLLVPLLVKLSNLVPEGGIWMNTQRPEWNDANNALAGWGLSMVTVCHIRRYLQFIEGIFAGTIEKAVDISASVARLLKEITAIFQKAASQSASERYSIFEALGLAGQEHRRAVYSEESTDIESVPVAAIREMLAATLPVIDATIRANRREDGMYHSYNLLQISGEHVEVAHLDPMLEGQVAVLASGLLSSDEVLMLLASLRRSALYRADQNSYLLYPDREIESFLVRNRLPASASEDAPALRELLAAGNGDIVVSDEHGAVHFQADLTNAADLGKALARVENDPRWMAAIRRDRKAILDLWERVFHHSAFTGRSGTMFGFEGLGSIYWHMVAKLLLSVQECHANASADKAAQLAEAYYDIRSGLGFTKSPAVYGAFPTDPYSHTPRHRGAQQPGMTGQVKEEILTRMGELGIEVAGHRLRFAPRLLRLKEFTSEGQGFAYVSTAGEDTTWQLPPQSLAFTVCQTPVCYVLSDAASITIERATGELQTMTGDTLSREDSGTIFERTGAIAKLTVAVPRSQLLV